MATESSPAFQFYPRDFIADGDQAALTLEEVGAYTRMLSFAWMKFGLPNDVEKIARMIGGTEALVQTVLREHFTLVETPDGGRWRNARQEEERRKQAKFRKLQSLKGVKSGKNRSEQRLNRGSSPVRTEPQPEGNSAFASASAVQKYPQPPEGAIVAVPRNGRNPLTVDEVFYHDTPDTGPSPVADLADRWTRLFAECRHGATFRPHPVHDYGVFTKLVDDYPDPEHLDEMIRFFFRADDLPAWAATRSPKCFLRLAPETDAAIRSAR